MSDPKRRHIECPDCHATHANKDQRIITGSEDGSTTTTWHKEGCPRWDDPLVSLSAEGQERPQLRLVRPDEGPTT